MSPKKDSDPSAPLVHSSEEGLDVEENEALDEGLEDKSDWPAHLDVQIKESKGRLSYLADVLNPVTWPEVLRRYVNFWLRYGEYERLQNKFDEFYVNH